MLPSTISSIRAIEGDEVLDYGGSVEAHRGAGASSARAQRWNERATSGHDRLTARRLTARAGLSQADSPRRSRSPKAATSSADAAAEARARHTKFAESTFTLAYTDRSAFFGGLEGRVGLPSPNLRAAMQTEHCAAADSQDEFTTTNYGVTTTPEVEWHAVVDPAAGLARIKSAAYPAETCGLEDGDPRRRADDARPTLHHR